MEPIPQIDVSLTDAVDGDTTITENLQVKGIIRHNLKGSPRLIYVGKEAQIFLVDK